LIVKSGDIRLERGDTGPAVLRVEGEHDLNTATQLREQLDRLIESGASVVVDLSPATFIDSTILGVLLDARRRGAERGVAVTLAQANGAMPVSRVLEITGLRSELPVHATVEGALAAAAVEPESSPARP
jgi:anti-sigma B factor antagonist